MNKLLLKELGACKLIKLWIELQWFWLLDSLSKIIKIGNNKIYLLINYKITKNNLILKIINQLLLIFIII